MRATRRLARSTMGIRVSREEAGVALPMALIVLVVLTALAAAVLSVGSSETSIATNHLRGAQAIALAEAGLESAFTTINTSPSLITSATTSFQTLTVTQPASGSTLAAYGSYAVQYRRVGTNTVEVSSTGSGASGGHRVLRAIMTTNLNSVTAVLSQNNIGIQGTTSVQGACGSVHSDANLGISGSADLIAQNATASGTYSASGSPTIGGESGGGRPTRVVPTINAPTFLAQAQSLAATDPNLTVYQLGSDGNVYQTGPGNSTTVLLTMTPVASGSSYLGWQYTQAHGNNAASWTVDGSSQPPGTTPPAKAVFYVNGDATIGASIGTAGTPWTTTIIAAPYGTPPRGGTLNVNPNNVSPYLAAALNDVVLVAGSTATAPNSAITFTGNPTINKGIIAAAGDIKLAGNTTLNGAIISDGATTLAGTVTVTYNCGLNSGITTGLSIVAWGY